MSVAFRRESDEEHKEPRFELPIPAGPNLVTRTGLELTRTRVSELQARVADEQDPLELEHAKRELRYWNTRLATAELMQAPAGGEVGFGSRVTFRLRGAIRSIDIVGDDEAEPGAGRIAFSAPLARAMMGAGEGDFADFAGEAEAIEVLKVERIDL